MSSQLVAPGLESGPLAFDDAIAGWDKSLHNVYTTIGDGFRQSLKIMDYWKLLRIQLEHHSLGHHMALALKERSTTELLGRNDAIKALKKENELLETKKAKLSEEVAKLASLRLELKAHVKKLPSFVGGAVDFGALAVATNFAKMLVRGGCPHAKGIQKEKLAELFVLCDTSNSLQKSVRNFMSTFWVFFGRLAARQMAEDRRVEDLQKKAAKGAAGPWPSRTSVPPPPKALSTSLALTLVAGEAMRSAQVLETEAAKEKEPSASRDADVQKMEEPPPSRRRRCLHPAVPILRCRGQGLEC